MSNAKVSVRTLVKTYQGRNDPEIILMDETFPALDAQIREVMQVFVLLSSRLFFSLTLSFCLSYFTRWTACSTST
jgi:hypothetical protein